MRKGGILLLQETHVKDDKLFSLTSGQCLERGGGGLFVIAPRENNVFGHKMNRN